MSKALSTEYKLARYRIGYAHRQSGLNSQFGDKWYRLGFRDGKKRKAA